LSLLPWAAALYPTPTNVSFFSKPLVTPTTMLLTNWRMVPLIALASRDSLAGKKVMLAASFWMVTKALLAMCK